MKTIQGHVEYTRSIGKTQSFNDVGRCLFIIVAQKLVPEQAKPPKVATTQKAAAIVPGGKQKTISESYLMKLLHSFISGIWRPPKVSVVMKCFAITLAYNRANAENDPRTRATFGDGGPSLQIRGNRGNLRRNSRSDIPTNFTYPLQPFLLAHTFSNFPDGPQQFYSGTYNIYQKSLQ